MKKKLATEIKTGIWIDQEKAYLIRLEGNKEPDVVEIRSGVESRVRFPGEGKVMARFGHAFIDDQEKKQRRQQQERKRYFDEILEQINRHNYLYLFGPGKAKEEFTNALEKKTGLKVKLVAIESAGRLTRNQLIEKTIKYFTGNAFIEAKTNFRNKLNEIL